MSVVTFPLCTVVDDGGTVVSGATVTVASVKDKGGNDILSSGIVLNVSGANLSVDYDAEANGEAWVTLAVSKVGSTFTGLNAAPPFFLARDSSRLNALYAAAVGSGGIGDFGAVSGTPSATSVTVAFPTAAPPPANVTASTTVYFTTPALRLKTYNPLFATAVDATHLALTFGPGILPSAPSPGDAAFLI